MPIYTYIPFDKGLSRHHTDREVRMDSQGRLVKVMFMLVFAMSGGALILLALEGKPIKPLPFSLTSQRRLNSPDTALGTQVRIEPGRWSSVEISYRTNQGQLSQRYGLMGDLAQKHHFVIADPSSGKDGVIFASQKWVKQLGCVDPPHDSDDDHTIRICLLTSDPDNPISSSRQARQLDNLVTCLIKHCRIEPKVTWKHQ